MMRAIISEAKWLTLTASVTITLTLISAYAVKRKWNRLTSKIAELEASLKSCSDKCASERQGRIRAQQALRKELTLSQPNPETCFPMTPIGVVRSCFSTRNGTPRQPLLVPLARASLVFNTTRVPPPSLEGLTDYSHCWILYVFHLNTDLDKLWKHPSHSGFKAKVRVPRLKGGRMGVFATRSPHRPCPIGLTVAKVEAVQGNMILLSGVDLVDGTPVLDVKPYLPYCDSIQEATVPNWLMEDNLLSVASVRFSEDFTSALENCWKMAERSSLYASPGEFQSLIKQVLSWDIRSVSQRIRPHDTLLKKENNELLANTSNVDEYQDETTSVHDREQNALNSNEVIYQLILEGLDVSYRIDHNGNVDVEKVSIPTVFDNTANSCNYLTWKDKLR
ncbi:hypothetical protein RJT34_32930 [Clitoria ternatea]|uniref:TsaA-like domain-containing protein n=1 Tax=Clitoria ternatea TaxID=43366 RepID=A0AAN9I477_CLITE